MLLALVLAGCGGGDDAGGQADATDLPANLTALSVDGALTPLNPVFDPTIARYSFVAAEPADGTSITAEAPTGVSIQINGQTAQSGQPFSLDGIVPDSEISIVTENEIGESQSYALVYLPRDFPVLAVSVKTSGVSDDPLYLTFPGYVAIVDNNGVPLFYRSQARRVFDFKRHPNGLYSYARQSFLNEFDRWSYEHVILDADLNEIDTVETIGLTHTDQHDYLMLDNGNHLLVAYHGNFRDLSGLGGTVNEFVEDSVVQEIDQSGNIVMEWNSWGNLKYEERIRIRAEYAHVNSMFIDTDGNVIVSSRGLAQIAKINWTTGDVMWKLGGISNEFTFLDDPFGNLCGQHTASRLPNGNLLLFDNGQICYPEVAERVNHTRVVEYELDETAKTVRLVWSYHQDDAYTLSQGSSQRLDNGNTLIGWGRGPNALSTEVDANGNKVFEISASLDGEVAVSYRAQRFPRPTGL